MLSESLMNLLSFICFLLCLSATYIWCAATEVTRFSLIYVISACGIFCYLNNLLINALLIDSIGAYVDGYVSVFNDEFLDNVKSRLGWLLIGPYLLGAVIGAYFGAKKKFINRTNNDI